MHISFLVHSRSLWQHITNLHQKTVQAVDFEDTAVEESHQEEGLPEVETHLHTRGCQVVDQQAVDKN